MKTAPCLPMPWVLRLCADIGEAQTTDVARKLVWNAFDKIAALPPNEHAAASQMISLAMRERGD